MNFTPNFRDGAFVGGVLIIAAATLMPRASHVGSMLPMAEQNTFTVTEPFHVNSLVWVVPAEEPGYTTGFQKARSGYYEPITAWYKNKHWWKRNAPIVGGAGGGAVVGGLVGGGKGALIGGAAGGGAG